MHPTSYFNAHVRNTAFTFGFSISFNHQFPTALMAQGVIKFTINMNQTQYPAQKTYILFAFKSLFILESDNSQVWINNIPNSQFGVRPILLTAQKESIDNVKFIMENIINPEVNTIEQLGLQFPQGHVHVKIIRSILGGKMSGILSGAGGAHCQLCTASFKDLKDIEMVRAGFPINRHISDAKELFGYFDRTSTLALLLP